MLSKMNFKNSRVLNRLTIAALVAATLTIHSCKDGDFEPGTTPSPEPVEKTISIEVSHRFDGQPLQVNTAYDLNGQTVTFTNFKYFLSDFQLTDDDGNSIVTEQIGEGAVLVPTTGGTFDFAKTTAETLHNVGFALGVDSLRNNADPMLSAYPLSLDSIAFDMHWGWTAGYKFMILEGMVEVDGTMQPFQYHIGFNEYFAVIPQENIDQTITGDYSIPVVLDIMGLVVGLEAGGLDAGSFHVSDHPIKDLAVENVRSGTAFIIAP